MDLERPATLRRLRSGVLCALLLIAGGPLGAAARQTAPPAAATTLAADLRHALLASTPEALMAISVRRLSLASMVVFLRSAEVGPTVVTIRERAREAIAGGSAVVADVFVARDTQARVATWQIITRDRQAADGGRREDIVSLTELGAIDGLVRLALDPAVQYDVRDLHVTARDLTLDVAEGQAFVVRIGSDITGLVLLGSGRIRFTPPSPIEQGQLRLYSGSPALDVTFAQAFIRVAARTLADLVGDRALVPTGPDPAARQRAEVVLGQRGPLSYGIAVGDLDAAPWTIDPPTGTMVVDVRTDRFGWLTYAQAPGDTEDVMLFDRAGQKIISQYASEPSAGAESSTPFAVERYDLDVRFDPSRSHLDGRGSLVLRTLTATDHVVVRLADALAVRSVSSPTLGRLLAMRVVGQDQLLISLPPDLAPGAAWRLDIEYAGELASQDLDREAVDVAAQAAPLLLAPTPRWLYSTRRAWYPQLSIPGGAYAPATVRVQTPKGFDATATGTPTRRDESADGAWHGTTFTSTRPIRYLAVVVTQFQVAGRTEVAVPSLSPEGPGLAPILNAPVDITVLATPREAANAGLLVGTAASIVGVYAGLVGEAPFPALTVAALDDVQPGGHSPPYVALVRRPRPGTIAAWRNDPVAFSSYPDFFLAHEIAHQWWGQGVGWATYHDQWLSEGLSQYFALRYLDATKGDEAADDVRKRMGDSLRELQAYGPISLGFRVGHVSGNSRAFRAIVYNKSAMVLDMLRRLIGPGAFDAGLRRFYRAHRFEQATTDELRAAFEAESGRSLARYFDEWIGQTALPRLRVSWRRVADGGATVHVEQREATLEFPLDLEVSCDDGRRVDVTVAIATRVSDHAVREPCRIVRVRPNEVRTLAAW